MISITLPVFVKWAGGKSKLIPQFKEHFPEKVESYYEPFLGGGAVFFYFTQFYKPNKLVLSDINHVLVELYRNVKENPDQLIKLLKEHKSKHTPDSSKYYYKMRERYNQLHNTIEKSALFLYLNKTCFNGLYRENAKGHFNVPIGRYKNPSIVNAGEIKKASSLLKNAEVFEQDFENILPSVNKNDFVYLDPPYHPVSETSSFTSYSKQDFGKEDQKRLAEFCKKLDKKGVKFMLSNSDTKFVKELYSEFNIHLVSTRRMISADKTKRKTINEVVVKNYS
ncbi:DNA adenine methylase [Candidatus Woesearchaeota archaeon]|nr:DNA adenine methylase [Candidatus Woesearchaeota archaeon]